MRIIALAVVLAAALTLGACQNIPGVQSVGFSPDPDHNKKLAVVAATLTVDAVAVYGALPHCDKAIKQPLGCRDEKRYQDVKLIAQLVAQDYSSPTTALLGVGLTLAQWQLAKTVRATPAPTDPNSPPDDGTVQYLAALNMADILVKTTDARVQDAVSVNMSLADLQVTLAAKVAALPN